MAKGKVYLVGAGPGHPKLITIRGLEVLRRSDTVVYDRLAGPHLLHETKSGAELIYVGKLPDRHTMKQEEINALLVKLALQGKMVTRLKGGDPSVFGRVGEEAEQLAANGIEYEIVPGITSALAVPAYAGIPATHRDYASSFAVITGHESPDKLETKIKWAPLSQAVDTLIFMMGVAKIDFISEQLMAAGRKPDTPVALVRWGTRAEQRTLTGTLRTIAGQVREADFQPPAVIVVGEVALLHEKLSWFEKKPLFGRRIMVTRARSQASDLVEQIEELGGEAYEFPLIKTRLPEDVRLLNELDESLHRLREYEWLIFTSANGVEFVWRRMAELRIDVRSLAGVKLAAVGPKTAEALERRGVLADLIPDAFRGEALANALRQRIAAGKRVLLARADKASDVLPHSLKRQGAIVDDVVAYETVMDGSNADQAVKLLQDGAVHAITFTSSSTVKNLWRILEDQGIPNPRALLRHAALACIGPVTASTLRELGLQVRIQAEEATIESLLEALIREAGK